ncbi:hypothetical protein [Lacinutrix sp. Hel_I_90]|uniref:glycosyltransferase n=1 Tax=Lacinutrix sp. Hel_I_90 TaxID=1249999 RepID=UPI0005CAC41F|nr:hypothetical protein [Lacinutrix sp. Hel_I_90]
MTIKTILVATNHLEAVGGSETFTYTLIESLVDKGYYVEYFTFYKGLVSSKIENELQVKFKSLSHYDLILANHNSCVRHLSFYGLTIQTCHGVFPDLEQPNSFADGHVSISQEVKDHLKDKGFSSKVILNGINCNRFRDENPINNELKQVLSLSQSSEANNKIETVCNKLNVSFNKLNKHLNPIWEVEKEINSADLVVALGRSAYEAMACGRPVLVYDDRGYFESYADGYLSKDVLDTCIYNNLSGRTSKLKFEESDIERELLKYNESDGDVMRAYALKNLNMDLQAEKYIDYAQTLKKEISSFKLLLVKWSQKYYSYLENKHRRKIARRLKRKQKMNNS